MAGNRFDFELVAKDEASATLKALEDTVAKMLPDLEKAGSKMQLGGKNTIEGLDDLNTRLDKMSNFAKAGVQYFGDMVPPLKLIGGLAMGLGGMAGVLNTVKNGVVDFANTGYRIDTMANGISMATGAFQELTGAMIENGSAREEAEGAITDLFDKANDAAHGRNAGFLALLQQKGIGISETKEGLADVSALMRDINSAMQTMSPGQQTLFIKKLGLSPELLSYLRLTTTETQALKDQAQRDGLILSDREVENAREFKQELNEITAAYDGIILKTEAWIGKSEFMSATLDEFKQIAEHGFDKETIGSILTFNHGGAQADLLRKADHDEDFRKTLSLGEKMDLNMGYASADLLKKIDQYYHVPEAALQLQQDMNIITRPYPDKVPPPVNSIYDQPRNNSLGLRNHNPLNLRAAPNETGKVFAGKNGFFSRFGSDEDGLAAASRQLFLYGDRGKHTLQDVIRTFAPPGENNVENYVSDVSRDTGFKPGENIDLHSPDILKRLLPAMIKEEQGTQPFSSREIDVGIQDAIFDPRWRGLRDPDYLLAQRNQRGSETEPAVGEHNAILTPQSPGQREPEYLSARRDQTQREEQPGIITPDQTADLTKALRDIIAQAGKNGKAQLEVTLTSANGEHKRVLVPFGGRVTTSMTPY